MAMLRSHCWALQAAIGNAELPFSPNQVCSGIISRDSGAQDFKVLHLSIHLSTNRMDFRPFSICWEFTAILVCEDSLFFNWKKKGDLDSNG